MDINALQNYYRIQQPQTGFGRVARGTGDGAARTDADTARADKVDISSEGSFKAQLAAYTKSYAAQSEKAASPEKIARLKQQYSGDACPVSGADIAGAITRYVLGAGEAQLRARDI
jgi:hypothetical protein